MTCAAAGVLVHAALAVAQQEGVSKLARPLETIIADLAAPEFARREAASTALTEGDDFTFAQLEAAITKPGLTPEQQARLSAAARARFLVSPRGAIGVSFGGRMAGLGGRFSTLVAQVFDRFPAKAILKSGDEIVAVEGVEIDLMGGSIRPYIICHDPGDKVKMDVMRDNARVTLEVPLGNFRDLPAQNGAREDIMMQDLVAAWKVRESRRPTGREALGAVAAANLRAEGVPEGVMMGLRADAGDDAMRRALDGEWPSVVAGGMTRDGEMDRFYKLAGNTGWSERRIQNGGGRGFDLEQIAAALNKRMMDRDNVNQIIQEVNRLVREAKPDDRAALEAKLAALIREREKVNTDIAAIQRQVTQFRQALPPRR